MHAIGVDHGVAHAGAIRVGLVHAHALGDHTLLVDPGLVIFDLRMPLITEDAFVHKGEVGDVEEVLDDPGSTGLDFVGAGGDFAEFGVVPFREGRDVVGWFAQTHPDQSVFFPGLIPLSPWLWSAACGRDGRGF